MQGLGDYAPLARHCKVKVMSSSLTFPSKLRGHRRTGEHLLGGHLWLLGNMLKISSAATLILRGLVCGVWVMDEESQESGSKRP